jgi:hypothetical protein
MTARWRREMRALFALYVAMIGAGLLVYLVIGLLAR